MSKTIGVILSAKNDLSGQVKPAIASLKEAGRQSEEAKKLLEIYKETVEQAKTNIKQCTDELEKHKKSIISQNREYQNAKSNIDLLKNSNTELKNEIAKQAMELDKIGQEYGSTSQEYKNAAKQLQALRQQYKNNSISIKEQTESLNILEETIIQNSDSIKEMKEQEKALKAALEQAENSLSDQRKEILRLGNSFKQVEKEVEKSKKTIKEWAKSVGESIDGAVKSALKWGAATASLVGGAAFTKGLQTSINLEAYRTMLETATKDFEKTNKLMKKAELLSISTPFDPEEVIQATATLESYGIDSEKWLSKIADAAGATNTTMEQATEAVKDILSKNEFETMENLGVSKEMLIEAAEKKYGKNRVFDKKGSVKDQKKLQIVLEEIMVSKFDGGAEKLSKTIKGLWSTITGSINMGLAKILGMENGLIKTGSILDIMKKRMESISEIILKWQTDGTLDNVAKKMTILFKEIVDSATKTYDYIKNNKDVIGALIFLLGIIYGLTKAVFAMKAAFEAYHIAVTALKNIEFLVAIFTKLKAVIIAVDLALTATPLGLIIKVIAIAVVTIALLIQNFETVKEVATNFFNAFDNWFNELPFFLKFLAMPFKVIVESIKLAVKALEGLGKVFNFVKDTFSFFFGDDNEVKKEIEENVKHNAEIEVAQTKIPTQQQVFEESFNKVEAPKSLNSSKATAIQGASIKNSVPAVNKVSNVYIQGDIYNHEGTKEMVAGMIMDILKNNMSNVT